MQLYQSLGIGLLMASTGLTACEPLKTEDCSPSETDTATQVDCNDRYQSYCANGEAALAKEGISGIAADEASAVPGTLNVYLYTPPYEELSGLLYNNPQHTPHCLFDENWRARWNTGTGEVEGDCWVRTKTERLEDGSYERVESDPTNENADVDQCQPKDFP